MPINQAHEEDLETSILQGEDHEGTKLQWIQNIIALQAKRLHRDDCSLVRISVRFVLRAFRQKRATAPWIASTASAVLPLIVPLLPASIRT